MKSIYALSLTLAVAVGYLSLSQGQQPVAQPIVSGQPELQRWEYKALDYAESALNDAGAEGWEAYAVTASNNSRVVYVRRHMQWQPSSNKTVPLDQR